MDPTWFRAFVERCRQRRSLPSVHAWVVAHVDQPAHLATSRSGPRAITSARNDVRTAAVASGAGVNQSFRPPGSPSTNNVFADLSLHDQAAATIASASQTKSGFSASMLADEGVAITKFRAYLDDFLAPHWVLTYGHSQTASHSSENHSKFVDDLVEIVVEGLRAVGADEEAISRAEESVRSLSKRLASSGSSGEEKLTLFSSFTMDRPNATDPIVYGIFFTTLNASYEQNGKTQVLSSTIVTYSIIYSLISGVLLQHADAYNALTKASVADWLASHTI